MKSVRMIVAAAAAMAVAAMALTAAVAPAAGATPLAKVVTLSAAQLKEQGFPKNPNLTNWSPGTATMPTHKARLWEDVIISGKAPAEVPVGQLLTMARFVPSDINGDGAFNDLNITAVVQKDHSYSLHFQLGLAGLYGYRVGYLTSSATPEFIGFQFQFETTGGAAGDPSVGTANAVTLGAKKLAKAGFTRTPNVVGWGGTATISASRAPAGSPVTIKGTAPAGLKPGTLLTLERFVPTDKKGSGSMAPVGGVVTRVAADQTFNLTFEINEKGRYGYTLGAPSGFEWVGVEFQLKTT